MFVGVLLLPFLNDGIGFAKFDRRKENRSFKDSVVIDAADLDNLPGDVEEYINDNFSFREPLIKSFSRIKYYGFGVSPKPEHTIIGKDGWLFMEKFEIDCYRGREDFDKEELNTLTKIWNERHNYFVQHNLKTYWLIAPIKHSVYSDKIPFKFQKSRGISRVDQLKKKFGKSLPGFIIDPAPELIKASTRDKVFYKMDNHWNYKAGLVATKLLIDRLSKDFPQVNMKFKVEWKDTTLQKGIHYDVLGLEELSEEDFSPIIQNKKSREVKKFGLQSPEGFAYEWEYERYFKNPDAGNNLKVLVIRDSFGEQMIPFVSELFSETLFIFDDWKYGLNEEIIEFYKPDIVVYITLETLMNNLLQ